LRIAVFISSFLLMVFSVQAQTLMKGIVLDGETGKPLFSVSIFNLSNEQSTTTNEQGYYSLPVKQGDELSYSLIGYHTSQRLATPGSDLTVELRPLSVQMQEYILHPDYTPFQKDSAEMASLYGKELNTTRVKTSVGSADGGGLAVNGLIGGAVQKMSKSYKKNKKFKETFKQDQEQKYIDTRYTPQLVNGITSFSGDTLATFMNLYPMEYPFARAATDLELKMWIRGNYKDYLLKEKAILKKDHN